MGCETFAGKKRLYSDLNDARKTNKYDDFVKKYDRALRPSINEVKRITRDMYEDTLDYSKGSPTWQIDSVTSSAAKKLLGRYGNKTVSSMDGKEITKAKYYLAQLIDAYGVGEASVEYDRAHPDEVYKDLSNWH
jgi:hypothetical protein